MCLQNPSQWTLQESGNAHCQWRTKRGEATSPAWKIQGKLYCQGKLKLLKNPER